MPQLSRLLALPGLQIGSLLAESWQALRGESPYADVPPMESSLRSIGEAVVDRSFSIGMNLLTGVPNPVIVRRAQQQARSARDFISDNGWLVDPRGFHGEPPPVGRSEEVARRWLVGRARREYLHLSFRSGYAPPEGMPAARRWRSFKENRTAHAQVLEHPGEPDRPWVVCVHGFGMGTPAANFPGFAAHRLHDELGLNVAFPTLPLHGPRGRGALSGTDLLSPDYLNLVNTFAQAVWDVRRLLRWIRARGGERIALYGVSLGGYTTAIVSAFEPDLGCVIAGVPPTDFSNVARDNEPWLMRTMERELQADWQLVRELTYVVSPLSFEPLPPVERRFIYAGIADRVVRPEQARALWRHWDRPEIHWFPGGHVAAQFRLSVQDFVVERLRRCGFDAA